MARSDAEDVFKEPPSLHRQARADDDEDDDRPRKKKPARDDDDEDEDDDRPRKKKPTRDEDEDDDDKPRKKKPARDDDDDDEDRPRGKGRSRDEDDDSGKPAGAGKPMPIRLIGAILVAFAWGFLSLHDGCLRSTGSILTVIQHHRIARELEEEFQRMRAVGFNQPRRDFGNPGELYTLTGTSVFRILGAVLLVAGAIMLLKRKALGKYLALAGPALMLLADLIGMVICLILSKGMILVTYNVDFLVNIVFSGLTAGCIGFLVMNKDVGKVLR
jgi:hypothetical protein